MNIRALLCLCLGLLVVGADASATSRDVKKRISIASRQLEQVRAAHTVVRIEEKAGPRDGRGRTKLEDIEQWAYTPALEQNVESLLREARAAADDTAVDAALDSAEKQLDAAKSQALAIAQYWSQKTAVTWREIWKQFAEANRIPVEPYDPQILAAERTVRSFLDSGDFAGATTASARIEAQLKSAMDAAASQIAQTRSDSELEFVPRATPCPGPEAPAAKAGLIRAANPNDYYPPGSKRREEQGAIIVRAHINAASCATEFAVVASSGFVDLDQAAIRVAEASRYAAATDNGVASEGYLSFKVRFVIAP